MEGIITDKVDVKKVPAPTFAKTISEDETSEWPDYTSPWENVGRVLESMPFHFYVCPAKDGFTEFRLAVQPDFIGRVRVFFKESQSLKMPITKAAAKCV